MSHKKMARKTTIPSISNIFEESSGYDYKDSFCYPLQRNDVETWELVAAFFMSVPKWVDSLMWLRNRLVSLFGLKGGGIDPAQLKPPYLEGQQIGVFKILMLSENEVVLGEEDRHLDFKTSLLIRQDADNELVISNIVRLNNVLGKFYFSIVKHVHQLIVLMIIKRMAKNIDQRLLPQHSKL